MLRKMIAAAIVSFFASLVCACDVTGAVIVTTEPSVPLSTLGGVPVFGRGASQAIFGADLAIGAADRFSIICPICFVEFIDVVAAGPSALGLPASPQAVVIRIANDTGSGVPASGFIGSYSLSGIDAEGRYTVMTPGLSLTSGSYWLEMLPATNSVGDMTMVAWNRTNTVGTASGTFDFGASWIQKPPTETTAFSIDGTCVPEPFSLAIFSVGAMGIFASIHIRKGVATKKRMA